MTFVRLLKKTNKEEQDPRKKQTNKNKKCTTFHGPHMNTANIDFLLRVFI